MEYKIILAESTQTLANKVTALLSKGFVPQGTFVVYTETGTNGEVRNTFAQAVVKQNKLLIGG
jgi:hypothetical protein